MNRVHIKIADSGWILEKCASEIAKRDNNVSYGLDHSGTADIQYYINYSGHSRRVSPIEIAFFTHSERDATARRRYFDTAANVDHCVCMSARYAQELIEAGIPAEKVTIIAPGVDLDECQPKVRIGVVGRTYHTGRKGEALVADVMDIPGIDWRFTGSGWPGPSVHVPEGGMAEFYNDLDYVLVPALYEGGPMSVLEGLACGIPIISSDVGWAHEYPHIPFENGNAESLRQVLAGLVAERQALRSSVIERSWAAWSEQHLELFDRLTGWKGNGVAAATRERPNLGVTLVTHGQESATLGGPSVRVPRTASSLALLGIDAITPTASDKNDDRNPIAHVFNVWPADSCHTALRRARASGKSTILSPIYLNLSNVHLSSKIIPQLFQGDHGESHVDRVLQEIAKQVEDEANLPLREPFEGYHAVVRACVALSDGAIFLSEYERRCLEHIGAVPRASRLIRNPVDVSRFAQADRQLFKERFGLDDYILCVGRIEHRKNQLILAHAAKTLGKQVVFLGHAGNASYEKLVRDAAGSLARFIPRIEPNDPLLPSAFAGASVFCLPSWAEGAPLAALEAAACGLPMVLSDRSSEQEYFGNYAEYVNPADVDGLRNALLRADEKRDDGRRCRALIDHVSEAFSWQQYAEATADFYEEIAKNSRTRFADNRPAAPHIYFDLTTSAHSSGNPTGISRVETRALAALLDEFGDRVTPVAWNSNTRNFIILKRSDALRGIKLAELDEAERSGALQVADDMSVLSNGWMVILGGAWIRNPVYTECLRSLKQSAGLSVKVLVHDLIQMKLSHLYPEGAGAEFEMNAKILADVSDGFLVYSETTRKDLRNFLISNDIFFKPIDKFRLGDMTNLHPADNCGEPLTPLQQKFGGERFVIYVSSIESRKNHDLLLNLWRRLVDERGPRTPRLVFIGKPIWNGERVVESVNRDPRLRSSVTILSDVNDQDLDWFYRNCEFTLYPSLYEGWGLPVAESLSYGKACITSSTTATAEIAPALTDLLDPYDFSAWHDRIALYLDNPTWRKAREAKIRSGYVEAPWDQSVAQIVSIVDSSRPAAKSFEIVYPQQTLNFFRSEQPDLGSRLCVKGWSGAERGGRWSVGPSSSLGFECASEADVTYARLFLRALTKSGETRTISISVDDLPGQVFELPDTPITLDLEIAARRGRDGHRLENTITFVPKELYSPQMISGSNDSRLLGVQLIWMQVAEEPSKLGPPQTPSSPSTSKKRGPSRDPALQMAKELLTLPPRFTGKRAFARFARAIGFDKLWLRMHARKFRRAYSSIHLIIDHLQSERSATK